MKNAIVWTLPRGAAVAAVEDAIKNKKMNVVAWFNRDRASDLSIKHICYKPERLERELSKLPLRNDVFFHGKRELLERHLVRFLDASSRCNFTKGRSYHELLNLFHQYLHYFVNLIKEHKADIVIFIGTPHLGADFMLYLAAKLCGIPTSLSHPSHLPNRFYIYQEIDDFGTFDTSPEMDFPLEVEAPEGAKQSHFYMKKIPHRRGFAFSRFLRDCGWAAFGGRESISWSGVFSKQGARFRYPGDYKRAVVHSVDYDKKFVYFPLQLQPELTTSCHGREFTDQLLAVEQLSSILPDDWYIYLKENPKQGFRQRDRYFYERMKRIPRCLYLDTAIPTHELIESSQFVATISGTVGWEAICGGKPAVIFGVTWFQTFPGVTQWRSDVTLSEIVDKEISRDALNESYRELARKTHPGIFIMDYKVLHEDYSEEENHRNLTAYLDLVLKDSFPC